MTLDLVGPQEVAERLGVQRETVHRWRVRGVLVDPEWVISGVPLWRWQTVHRWARATGRLPAAGQHGAMHGDGD